MTLVLIINAFLCLAVLITTVGSHTWVIVRSHREAAGIRLRRPEPAASRYELSDLLLAWQARQRPMR